MSENQFDVLEELKKMKREEEEARGSDVIQRTISSLISVEKQALYGNLKNKQKKVEEIIQTELINYRKED